MLIGHYIAKLTEKNRAALPKKFREEIGDSAIIARWYEGCLVIVSNKSWSDLLNKLTGKTDLITLPVRDTDRFILGSAFEIETDNQGRFVVPKVLIDYAKITHDIVFVGLMNRIEVWDMEIWQKREDLVAKNSVDMVEELSRQRNLGVKKSGE
ncbi:hypothetical protein A3A76_03510 [Candidatus Woesebacteria bacterium RIFCSPLOWO2_01_FULL_39_23]|uniref:Transcriptional regulator MraZ n=1 Tax=Candidatus Woesebacteria bacterium RIFCSPHIGHO2_01_FULL_40_22 TaxID=1802499 RepID=A0A1F7YJQ5_9BACT|nr:MAG: hypothetical protein A2141_00515 [Candidatus Woesebacteria bacterium RBG_16_40_11]OGM27523.1 MAG: hypothetical protein A2628_01910 [Candidatus Woesebacteria bacterium RIFCSPHIGHO2_01_FULL_40_22]OGM36115.1 MAG: hypothetical protein A3E41_02150 [Candidatus Woesebacteria bacterium RIFCSPHIGHO2_12_FULL_38_9]OGM62697.1 MAG: hypothetical protein A3A76_03510 [Candidatus Woesebacteria bacterium RIFCSPLOWO2_01_FULL_39_23]